MGTSYNLCIWLFLRKMVILVPLESFLSINVLINNEGGIELGFPNILIKVITLRGYDNLMSNQIRRVEANTQMIE